MTPPRRPRPAPAPRKRHVAGTRPRQEPTARPPRPEPEKAAEAVAPPVVEEPQVPVVDPAADIDADATADAVEPTAAAAPEQSPREARRARRFEGRLPATSGIAADTPDPEPAPEEVNERPWWALPAVLTAAAVVFAALAVWFAAGAANQRAASGIDNRALVLVFADQHVERTADGRREDVPVQVTLRAERVDGKWRISDIVLR